jgi:hypothetical protein
MRRLGPIIAGALTAGALTVGGLLATTGSGAQEQSRAPLPAERTAIAASARSVIPLEVRPKVRITGIRVSTRSRYWAKASALPLPAFRSTLEGAGMVLVRSAVTGRWTVVDIGTDAVGCRIAPISVLRDLGMAASCPDRDRL